MKTIQVTGKANLVVAPDQTKVTMTLENIKESYADTIKKCSVDLKEVKRAIKSSGLDPKKLKTSKFYVNPSYDEYYDEKKIWRKKFKGFKYLQQLTITFHNDNKTLSKLLYNLSLCECSPHFQINYTIKDVEGAKNELLRLAVVDSKMKAEILASASNVELGSIVDIDYSWTTMEFISSMDCKMGHRLEMASADDIEIDIEPEDINVRDNVKVVWEIK